MGRDQYILNERGEPEAVDDMLTWARWFENAQRRVAWTSIAPGVDVSTVFLGLDHSFGGGQAVLWETLVFGGPLDGEMDRYTSRAAAEAGHAAMVERAR